MKKLIEKIRLIRMLGKTVVLKFVEEPNIVTTCITIHLDGYIVTSSGHCVYYKDCKVL
jgi:hypothetical protein